MGVYSIRDIERLSGIKAHTLRIWESRYGIINPRRTDTNIRYYGDEELRYVMNISLLNKNGFKISKIAAMSREQVAEKVAAISEVSSGHETQLDAMTISMVEMDEAKFDHIMRFNTQKMGFERTMVEIIHPFLDKLSLLWLTGSLKPAQENFMSALIRRKIIAAIDREPLPRRTRKSFLLYLPEGERQELSLLFVHYLLRRRGFRVIYLGSDTGLLDLVDACAIHQPDYFYTIISETFARVPLKNYVDSVSKRFAETTLLLSGYQPVAQEIPNDARVRVLRSLTETVEFAERL